MLMNSYANRHLKEQLEGAKKKDGKKKVEFTVTSNSVSSADDSD
jgi:hypothetical protein